MRGQDCPGSPPRANAGCRLPLCRKRITSAPVIDRLRALFTVVEEGSVNRAALRLRISQPALSRQMKSLEDEVGGRLLERDARGVKPTDLGHALMKAMRPVLAAYETALADVRRRAGGARSELRVGYLVSAAQAVLTPALAQLRRTHPDLKLRLHDMSPREQLDALRKGELDVAITGQEGAVGVRDFHCRKLCSMGLCVAMSAGDPLARKKRLFLQELKTHGFIGVDEAEMPGRNRWMTALCRAAGFRPRFLTVTDGITHVLSLVASESAVTLLPDYFRGFAHPGVVFVPVKDKAARWDFLVLWQRGRTPPSTLALVEGLSAALKRMTRAT